MADSVRRSVALGGDIDPAGPIVRSGRIDNLGACALVIGVRDADAGAAVNEILLLTEIDADGRLVASINFDAEARAEALVEAEARAQRSDAPRETRTAPSDRSMTRR